MNCHEDESNGRETLHNAGLTSCFVSCMLLIKLVTKETYSGLMNLKSFL